MSSINKACSQGAVFIQKQNKESILVFFLSMLLDEEHKKGKKDRKEMANDSLRRL